MVPYPRIYVEYCDVINEVVQITAKYAPVPPLSTGKLDGIACPYSATCPKGKQNECEMEQSIPQVIHL